MKAYSDLEESKKLAKILPLESADMYYFTIIRDYPYSQGKIKTIVKIMDGSFSSNYDTPCWSLSALFDVFPKGTRLLKSATDDTYHCDCPKGNIDKWFDNPVDACVAMIIKLHELKML